MNDPVSITDPDTSHSPMTSASTLLADAAKVAAQLSVDASVTAKEVIATAADVALKERDRQENDRDQMKNVFMDALNQVFGEKEESQQFINISRVPLLCIQVKEIHGKLETIVITLEELKFVKKFLYAIFGLVGSGVVVAFGVLLTVFLRK